MLSLRSISSFFYKGVFFNDCEKTVLPIKKIPFNQSKIISSLNPQKYPTLSKTNLQFNGLCEIICNYVLLEDLLGKGTDDKFLERKITIDQLNEKIVSRSHILEVYPTIWKLSSFFLKFYPDNLFSYLQQRKLLQLDFSSGIKKINKSLFESKMEKIPIGTILKVAIIDRFFGGHSVLLKKTGSKEFTVFDPNQGELRGLSLQKIFNELQFQINQFNAVDVLCLDGNLFKKRICHLRVSS